MGERERKRLQKGDFVKNNGHATTSQRENGNNTEPIGASRSGKIEAFCSKPRIFQVVVCTRVTCNPHQTIRTSTRERKFSEPYQPRKQIVVCGSGQGHDGRDFLVAPIIVRMIHSFWQDQRRECSRAETWAKAVVGACVERYFALPKKNLSWYRATVEYVRVKSQGSLNRKKHSAYRRITVAWCYCRRTYMWMFVSTFLV